MIELKPLQVEWYQRIRVARASGARIIACQAATGFGKNTVAAFMALKAAEQGRTALLVVHLRKLVDQIHDRLDQFGVPHGILMRGEPYDRTAKIYVGSRDTLLSRCVNNEWIGMPPADLVIVDEGHHAAMPTSEYRRILDFYPAATILLLTATPVGVNGDGMGPWAQALICAAPTSQLIREGYLVPLQVKAPDRKKLKTRKKRGVAGDLVESWKQYAEGRRTVLFCGRVQHSLDACAAFAAEGIRFHHIDAKTLDCERDDAIDLLQRGRLHGISNVGIIGEGWDCPALDCCQLYFDVGSRTRLLQTAGRVMRTAPGKTHGILIDHSAACYRYGFPDEDQDWLLTGNTDAKFQERKDAGETEKARYCGHCDLLYHSQEACPECGRLPVKPPRSVFLPPPVETTGDVLVNAERGLTKLDDREERIKHWFRCLGVAANRNGSIAQARVIYHKKYRAYPEDGFPCTNHRFWKDRVKDVYPNFVRRKQA